MVLFLEILVEFLIIKKLVDKVVKHTELQTLHKDSFTLLRDGLEMKKTLKGKFISSRQILPVKHTDAATHGNVTIRDRLKSRNHRPGTEPVGEIQSPYRNLAPFSVVGQVLHEHTRLQQPSL